MAKIIGSAYEHDAIYKYLDTVVKSLEELERVLQDYSEEDKIVFWMLSNNITGTVYNTREIGKLCHKYGACYIMDCTASIGHNLLDADVEDYCDCILTSSHKYHGEIGNGCMWVSDRLASLLDLEEDSHDEYGLIPGTPNVAGARAMADALEYTIGKYNSGTTKKLYADLVKHLNFELDRAEIPYRYVGAEGEFSNAINAITFPEMNADALVQYLSSKGIYISAGHSACSSDDPNASRVLEAFGLTRDEAEHTVRISFCEDNTLAEIDELVENIVKFRKIFC